MRAHPEGPVTKWLVVRIIEGSPVGFDELEEEVFEDLPSGLLFP